jgi:hypothetical protein
MLENGGKHTPQDLTVAIGQVGITPATKHALCIVNKMGNQDIRRESSRKTFRCFKRVNTNEGIKNNRLRHIDRLIV